MKWNIKENIALIYLSEGTITLIFLLLEAFKSLDEFAESVSIIKDMANILFFLTVPYIAWRTYKQAYNTIFNTQKNEVFKKQMDELDALHKLIYIKNDKELLHKLDFYTSFHKTSEMVRSRLLGEKTEYPTSKDLESSNFYHLDKIARPLVLYETLRNENEKRSHIDRTKFSIDGLYISDKHNEMIKKLSELEKSSITPTHIAETIGNYIDSVKSLYPRCIDSLNTVDKRRFRDNFLSYYPANHASQDLRETYEYQSCASIAVSLSSEIKNYMKIDEVME